MIEIVLLSAGKVPALITGFANKSADSFDAYVPPIFSVLSLFKTANFTALYISSLFLLFLIFPD